MIALVALIIGMPMDIAGHELWARLCHDTNKNAGCLNDRKRRFFQPREGKAKIPLAISLNGLG